MKTLLVLLLATQPVVVELFTSQGCSSCPPAEAVLSELRKQPNVIPIAYHVDYWNYLGWRDPFSSQAWTQRQMQYVRSLKLNSAYTPQVVVDGEREVIGSNGFAVRAAIEEASQHASVATLKVNVDHGTAIIDVNAPRAGLELLVVTTEDGLVTKIERGENRGRTQTNDAIAQKLVRFANVTAGAHTLRVPTEQTRGTAIVMLQDPNTLHILAAASAPIR
jgi:hypothetical protein